jgi:UDP-N-acetylglucosamine 2-epimerase
MHKIMTICGTRPELIKMCRIIHRLDELSEHVFVHTGQNYDYELNQVFFDDLGLREPDYFMDSAGETAVATIANVIRKAEVILREEMPDAILIYGDTNSCLVAITAKRLKIPVFHLEAGNRCFDQRVPEELNRKIVDHLSDINMTLSEHARRYLLDEGLDPRRTFHVGSNMPEVFGHFEAEIERSNIVDRLGLRSQKYVLVSIHREENVDYTKNLSAIIDSLNALVEYLKVPVIVSTHPRTRKRLDEHTNITLDPRIKFLKPFGFFDYNNLQKNALIVVSDSGTIFEETSILGLRSITVRNSHERPEGMDSASVLISALSPDSLLAAVKLSLDMPYKETDIKDYGDGETSKKIIRILFSYIDFVNREVWKKDVH